MSLQTAANEALEAATILTNLRSEVDLKNLPTNKVAQARDALTRALAALSSTIDLMREHGARF